MDPKTIALDIETYGIHTQMPDQTCFQPARSLHVDRVSPQNLVLTAAITLVPTPDPHPAWNAASLASLSPGPTLVLRLNSKHHRRLLYQWLEHADTILGMNLQFDLSYLRAFDSLYALSLNGRHTLIDLSVLNYLQCESRPERSLKSLGPVLGTHVYDPEDLQRFSTYDRIEHYNAQDTHNTVLAVSALASRILHDSPSGKLSPFCIHHFSDTIWDCIQMTENGVPFHHPSLLTLFHTLHTTIQRIESQVLATDNLKLSGPGSQSSKDAFLQSLISASTHPDILSAPQLQFTEVQHKLSFSDANRTFLASHLPPSHPLHTTCQLIQEHSTSQKLLSTYLYPMLFHSRTRPSDRSSLLCPSRAPATNPLIYLDHPSWYIVPTFTKDDSGSSGGTIQGRITCKKGPRQTDPPAISSLRCSRFPNGLLVSFDLSQIELRVAALLSADLALLSAFTNNLDLHTDRAIQIFTLPYLLSKYGPDFRAHPSFLALERQVGKGTNFADLFRSGAATMQAQILASSSISLPLSFFEDIVRTRPILRPGLWAWQEARIREAHTTGRVILPLTGHSRSFLGGDLYDINEIVNFPIQTIAGITLLQIQHLLRRSLQPHSTRILPFLNGYDALFFDIASPTLLPILTFAIASAVHTVSTSGYWHLLSQHHDTHVPLSYTIKSHTFTPPTHPDTLSP